MSEVWKRKIHGHCVVNTQVYLTEVQRLLGDGYEVSIPVSGVSMMPCLRPWGDCVKLSPFAGVTGVPGMIVLFRRTSGDYVLHRIIHCRSDGFFLAGDAQCALEGPVKPEQVLGWVSHVSREGMWRRLWKQTGLGYGVLWRWCFPVRRWYFALVWRWNKWMRRITGEREKL